MNEHTLKSWPMYFDAVLTGRKRFELRKDDRGGFRVGDILKLKEWCPDREAFSGRFLSVRVTYCLPARASGGALQEGYVCMNVDLLAAFTP